MNPKQWLMVGVMLLVCGAATPVWGQVAGSVQVDGFVDPNNRIDIFEPNIFDLDHPKLLTFDGLVFPTQPGAPPTTIFVQFDWYDPFVGGFVLSPAFPHVIVADPITGGTHVREEWTIPYCPPEVSLHLFTQTGEYEVHGLFTHECIIPEPSSMLLLGLAIPAFACAAWRKRRR